MAQAPAAKQRPGSTRTLLKGADGAGTVRRTVLPGGLRVVTETLPTVRSATFGIWVGVGSRDETPQLNGATHYLEHLLFKGTARRSALDISAALDAVGGEMNAFTAKENTCYYARVLDTDLPLAIDVVCDMVTGSLIRSEDVDAERGVILEEMAMAEDDPGDVVHDLFAKVIFGSGPLGRPILGTQETIKVLTREQIAGFYRRRYRPENLVVSAAGNLDHHTVVKQVEQAFAAVLARSDAAPAEARRGVKALRTAGRVEVLNRSTEQAHLVLGVPGVPRHDERRWAMGVLNAALGGGMSLPAVPGGAGEARPGVLGVLVLLVLRGQRPVRHLRRLPAQAGRGGAADLPRGAGQGGRRGHHRRGAAARDRPDLRLHRAGHGGHRLADEPDRQGRAELRTPPVGGRDAGADRGRDPGRRPRGGP